MFKEACKKVRESVYGVIGTSIIKEAGSQVKVNATNATAFMVFPEYLITAAHFVHQENNIEKPVHQNFEVIRAPKIGGPTKKAIFVAEDTIRDIALIKIENSDNNSSVELENIILARGNSCGFLGFPLSEVTFLPDNTKQFNLLERFQGSYISNYMDKSIQSRTLPFYEVDTLMYPGSSGCPGFNPEGKVMGMQVASEMRKDKEQGNLERVAISLVVPSTDILTFLKKNKILS